MTKNIFVLLILLTAFTQSFCQTQISRRLMSNVIAQQNDLFIHDSIVADSMVYTIPLNNKDTVSPQNVLLKTALQGLVSKLEIEVWKKLGYTNDEAIALSSPSTYTYFFKSSKSKIYWVDIVEEAISRKIITYDDKTKSSEITVEFPEIPIDAENRESTDFAVTDIPKSYSAIVTFKIIQPTISLNIKATTTSNTKEAETTVDDHLIGYFTKIEITKINSVGRAISSKNFSLPGQNSSFLDRQALDYINGGVGLDVGWWRDHPRIAPTVQATALYANIEDGNSLQFFGFIDGGFHMSVGADPDDKKFILDIPSNATYGIGVGYNIFSLGFVGQESYYNFSTAESHNEGLFRGGFTFGIFIPFYENRGILIKPLAGWYVSKNRMFGVFKAPESDKINNFGGHLELILDKNRLVFDYSRVKAYYSDNQIDGIGHIIQCRYNHTLKNEDIIMFNFKYNNWRNDFRDSNVDFHISYIKGIFN